MGSCVYLWCTLCLVQSVRLILPLTLVPKATVIHSHSEWGPEAHTVVPLPSRDSGWPEAHTPTESGGRGPTLGVGVKALSVVWPQTMYSRVKLTDKAGP